MGKDMTGKKNKRERGETVRASYDIPPDLRQEIYQRSIRLGIPASQLAMFLLADGLRRLVDGEIDPEPYLILSTSPKFRNNLVIDPEWYPDEILRKRKEEKEE